MRHVAVCLLVCLSSAAFSQTSSGLIDTITFRAKQTNTEALIIWKNGKLLAEQYRSNKNQLNQLMSVTKSIVGLAVGKLITEGAIKNLDVPVWKYYPEWKQGQKQYITLRHLLSHTSGMQNVENATVEIYPAPDVVKLALAAELSDKSGAKFSYNNKAVNLLAGIIKIASGQRMDLYIKNKIFTPLRIINFKWELDKAGNPHVMAGCQLSSESLLKIGQLLINNGRWNGKQIINSSFIAEMMKPQPAATGYGLLWWLVADRNVSVVSSENIDMLKKDKAPPDFLEKAYTLVGEYATDIDFEQALRKTYGADLMKYVGFIQRMRSVKLGNIIGVAGRGYLGNYITIIPSKKLVAIRTINPKDFRRDEDNFYDFETWVVKLSQRD